MLAAALTKAFRQRGLVNNAATIRLLLELIAALDRRVPQVQRAGEATIAHEAAALKAKAFTRIAELERDLMAAATPQHPKPPYSQRGVS